MIPYPLIRPHDPDGTRDRTIEVALRPGDGLLPATTLVPVDANDAELVGGTFSVEIISIGLISAVSSADIWGVNYRLLYGADMLSTTALIRLRPWLASQPDRPAYDQTFRVQIKNT